MLSSWIIRGMLSMKELPLQEFSTF